MEPDHSRAIMNLKMRILGRESEKKRLQGIIGYSQAPDRRMQAVRDLADLMEEIRTATDELARLEAEE
jgi:hypothetical protein